MNRETWSKWVPVEGIPQTVYCESIEYNSDGLTIKIQGENVDSPIFTINFEFFLALRVMDEGNFLKKSDNEEEAVFETGSELSPGERWSLFTVKNSPYLKWFHDQSVGIHRDINIIHYTIITPGDIVDVLASVIPVAKWN